MINAVHSLSLSQVVLKIFAATFCLLGLAALVSVPVTMLISDDAEARSTFRSAAHFVDDFLENTDRLPRDAELGVWKDGKGNLARYVAFALESDLPIEARDKFGAAPATGYVLSMWRGESFDYYASWADDTTIAPVWRVVIVSVITGFVLLAGARLLWKL